MTQGPLEGLPRSQPSPHGDGGRTPEANTVTVLGESETKSRSPSGGAADPALLGLRLLGNYRAPGQPRTRKDSPGQPRTAQDKTGQPRTRQDSLGQPGTAVSRVLPRNVGSWHGRLSAGGLVHTIAFSLSPLSLRALSPSPGSPVGLC